MKTLYACASLVLGLVAFSGAVSTPAKDCEELKKEIAEKLDAKGVKGYTLEIVKNDDVKDAKVVGSCGGGTMKITYVRS